MDIFELSVKELLKNDFNNLYKNHLSHLSNKYVKLKKWFKTANKIEEDEIVLEATKVFLENVLHADQFLKQTHFEKKSKFVTKIIIKTLKVALKILAGLLLKNPFKVGIAYNAMHNVIKHLEKELK